MADPESSVFKKVASEIEDDLFEELCVKKLPCIGVKVFKLAKGSVIVSYNVHMASSTKYKRSDVQNVISDAVKGGELGRLKVRNVVVEKEKEEEESSSSSSRVFIYVLCGVGAFLVIAVIIVAVSKVRKRITLFKFHYHLCHRFTILCISQWPQASNRRFC